ncbi:hypothetical protein DFH07DRAFT_1013571 [Mycena maculata]|uniref:Uncharacterized protein n=1 Tax=Mycena maculata TaxID=230809 RepID=A0AAD7NME8_9AGAR|nr:hypothetical protein DFH07DRAFT_1013571 [Mycena maculata]
MHAALRHSLISLLNLHARTTNPGRFPVVAAVAANFSQLQQPFKLFDIKKKTNLLNAEVDLAINLILKDFNSPGKVGVAVVKRHKDGSSSNSYSPDFQQKPLEPNFLDTKITSFVPEGPHYFRREHHNPPPAISEAINGFLRTVASTTHFSGESGNLADGMARDSVNQMEDVFRQGTVQALTFWAPNKGDTGHDAFMFLPELTQAIWLQMLLSEGQHLTSNVYFRPFPELSSIVNGGGQNHGEFDTQVVVWGFNVKELAGHKAWRIYTRIPTQDLGVAVLSNDQSFGTQIMEAIKFRILDEALKLQVVDWSGRAPYDPQIQTLLARWNKVELAYVSAAQFDHNVFNVRAISSIPTGNSSDRPYWVSVESSPTSPSLVAEFAYDGILGVGMRGGMQGRRR